MTSYSQYGEDNHIRQAVGEIPNGRLLDLGAWHPTVFSNSRALLEAGWEGVLVECSPGPLRDIVREYATWPRVTVIGAAVGFDRRLIEIQATDDAFSTSDAATLEKWKDAGGYYGRFWAPVIILEDIAEQFGGEFDFVNFDTEGTSVDLFLRALDLGWRPKCACVEHDNRFDEAIPYADSAGYRTAIRNGTNIVFTR